MKANHLILLARPEGFEPPTPRFVVWRSAGIQSASIILRSNTGELSKNIIQKGLAFGRDWSGTVGNSGAQGRSEILPRRLGGRGGASVVRRDAAMNRTEDLNVEVCEKATSRVIEDAGPCVKAFATTR